MKDKEEIYNFLIASGFEMTKEELSPFFDDYYAVFGNQAIQLRFSRDKSFEAVDIRNNGAEEEWYDLTLLEALLCGERSLNKVIPMKEQISFLLTDFLNIMDLFEEKNYPATKKKLHALQTKRVKHLFP